MFFEKKIQIVRLRRGLQSEENEDFSLGNQATHTWHMLYHLFHFSPYLAPLWHPDSSSFSFPNDENKSTLFENMVLNIFLNHNRLKVLCITNKCITSFRHLDLPFPWNMDVSIISVFVLSTMLMLAYPSSKDTSWYVYTVYAWRKSLHYLSLIVSHQNHVCIQSSFRVIYNNMIFF